MTVENIKLQLEAKGNLISGTGFTKLLRKKYGFSCIFLAKEDEAGLTTTPLCRKEIVEAAWLQEKEEDTPSERLLKVALSPRVVAEKESW